MKEFIIAAAVWPAAWAIGGAGAVAGPLSAEVALDTPPEALTMNTWASLKESLGKIVNEVRQIVLVKNDIGMLQEDLKSQEQLWRQAELDLGSENIKLRLLVAKLQGEAQKGAAVEAEVTELQHRIEDAKARNQKMRQDFQQEEMQMAMENNFTQRRQQQLSKQLKALNASADHEVRLTRKRQMQVRSAEEALRLKAAELEDQLRDGQKELPLQAQQSAAKTRELKRQITEMKQGLRRMVGQIQPREQLERELESLQAQLKEETMVIINVKQQQVEVVARCDRERKERQEALYAEESKAKTRRKEMLQLCGAMRGQRAVLQQMVSSCEAAASAPA
mmetsp:Transcript_30243/g.94117  ORF Transcript_30243/g.94117 Transcript_30243/m.94117 type:complete len:335 (-) Transcript_30243:66-1070(-)